MGRPTKYNFDAVLSYPGASWVMEVDTNTKNLKSCAHQWAKSRKVPITTKVLKGIGGKTLFEIKRLEELPSVPSLTPTS